MNLQKEREMFEAWVGSNGRNIERFSDGSYKSMTLDKEWKAWQEAKAQAIPDGFVVVPKEPTPKMIDATWDFDEEIQDMSHNSRNEFIYNAMIAAAQEPTND